MSLQWKVQTNFPFSRVFVLGVILFFLGLASMIIAIIAFVTHSWGHYVGTGMWGGATVLGSGITAVLVSRLRSLASVKTFCLSSVIAMFTSLTMLILSAGGLTLNSGFYSRIDLADYSQRTSNLIHASLLVISVFCLSGDVLAVIVCCKYLFFEPYDKPKRRRRHRNLSDGNARAGGATTRGAATTGCHRPATSRSLVHNEEHMSRRHSDIIDTNRVQIEYRRAHKRSASDQPQSISHLRRHKHTHHDVNHAPNCSSSLLLPSNPGRLGPDRNINNRSSAQSRELRGSCRESERPCLVNARQACGRPLSQVLIEARLCGNAVSISPRVRLPTEFDEEELPPYEAQQSSSAMVNISPCDSGDESDTENSSSSDAQSFMLSGEQGAEAVPMIELQEMHNIDGHASSNVRQHNTVTSSTCLDSRACIGHSLDSRACAGHSLGRQTCSGQSVSSVNVYCNGGATSGKACNKMVGDYMNTCTSSRVDCDHLLSVSPEVCAITGESPEPSDACHQVPHARTEHFYENGPCYENIECVGQNGDATFMNHLSKSPSANFRETKINATRVQENDISALSQKSPIKVVTVSSPISNTSLHSPMLNVSLNSPSSHFGSMTSAFRPVVAAPHHVSSPIHMHPNLPNSLDSVPASLAESSHSRVHESSPPKNNHTECSGKLQLSGATQKYVEQGAIPKSVKHKDNHTNKISMSWKNIPLPLSYNHSESASDEYEKKLPSKTIPLAESNIDRSRREAENQSSSSSKLSPRVYPANITASSSVVTCSSMENPASPFQAASEALLETPLKNSGCRSTETSKASTQLVRESTPAILNTSSVREASTQISTSTSSRWHIHQMGGNQYLIQSRREDQLNNHLSHRPTEASGRATRPSSMPTVGRVSNLSHAISGLVADRSSRNRLSEASTSPAVTAATRQNHLLHHYPLQPQQPRLGVQLHQRRQQQHQLQQNIESQNQHQQQQHLMQQQQQQPPENQPNRQNQPGRSGRPLFSVLL